MLKISILSFLLFCIGVLTFSVLPISSERYLRIKSTTVNLNGKDILIESSVDSTQQESKLNGLIYVFYKSDDFFQQDCQLGARLIAHDNKPAPEKANCTSGDKHCDTDYTKRHYDRRMFMKIESTTIKPINLALSTRNNPTETGAINCPIIQKNLKLVPEWYKVSIWQKMFAR